MSEETGRRVLLADDCQMTRDAMATILKLKGWQVTALTNGREAVQAIQEARFDVVLLDVQMPWLDGLAATRAIRLLPPPLCRVPIIGLTAHSYRTEFENCLAAGMNLCLAKPLNFRMLDEEMNRLLQVEAPSAAADEAHEILDELLKAAAGEASTVHAAVNSYLEAYREQLQFVSAAVDRRNAGDLQKCALRLAGSIGFFSRGAPLLLSRQLAELGAQNRLEQAPEKLAELQREMELLFRALEKFCSEAISPASS